MPALPSLLPAKPAVQDTTTTADHIQNPFGTVALPQSTPIFICAYPKCNRLLPNLRLLMAHRKKDHHTEDNDRILTWNDTP